jgi:hypothetical protein
MHRTDLINLTDVPQRGHLELDHVEAEEVFGKAHVAERIDFRQRKSRGVAATLPSPSPPSPQVIELALRGLHNLGFTKSDARRAVDHLSQHRVANGDPLDLQDVLGGAIAALT